MKMILYTLEDGQGEEILEFYTQNYEEAKCLAERHHLRIISNEYEFLGSFTAEDFTLGRNRT